MGELAPEFKQKIANFDGNASANNQEKDVIFYLESYTQNMPPEYLNKLIDAIKMKLRDKELNKDQIYRECGKAIKELNEKIENEKRNRSLVEKSIDSLKNDGILTVVWKVIGYTEEQIFETNKNSALNVNMKLWLPPNNDLDKKGFSKKGLHGFNKKEWWNYFISIQDFENKLKSGVKAEDINSRALSNYFQYLHAEWQLKPEILVQKFWGNVLLWLGEIWKKWGNKEDTPYSLLAYRKLQESNLQYIIDIVIKLNSENNIFNHIKTLKNPAEQEVVILLLQEKESSLKTKFKNELKVDLMAKNKTMEENKANHIIDELLLEVSNHKWVQWLTKIYKAFDNYSKKYGVPVNIKEATKKAQAVKKAQSDSDRAKLWKERSETQDLKKIKEIDQKLKQQEIEGIGEKVAARANEKMQESDIQDLVSWKKKIDQVIQEFKKEDKEFAQEYKIWKKEKEKFDQENPIKWTSVPEKTTTDSRLRTGRGIPFDKIDSGKPHTISLDRRSDNADTVTIMCHGDSYIVQVGNNIQNTTELTKEKIPAYVQSLRFMEKLWLGYFIRNLPANKLSQVLENTSRGSVRVNNKDGDFDIPEKKRIIASFGKFLDIPRTDNAHPKDGPEIFQNYFKNHISLENILYKGRLIQNGTLQIAKLEKSLKSV